MEKEPILLRDMVKRIIKVIKKHIILAIAIILLVNVLGVVFAYNRKPTYVASEDVIYQANTSSTTVVDNDRAITEMYFATILDFCTTNCVIDRANFYYEEYINSDDQFKNVGEFINHVKVVDESDDLYYTAEKRISNKHIYKSNISITANTTQLSTNYEFVVKYSDLDYIASAEKVKILILAVDEEANVRIFNENKNKEEFKYFGVSVTIQDMGLIGIYVSWTKFEMIAIAFIISIILVAGVLYLVESLNKTIKTAEELEEITGLSMLACIEDQGR